MIDGIAAVLEAGPYLLWGAGITMGTIAGAMFLGLILGVPLAVLQVYGNMPARRLVGLYVWFFRGVPILVLLYLFYFGLAYQLGLDVSPFGASCLVLGLVSGAYQSQIFRGGIMSLPVGQMKAGMALGMTRLSIVRHIILPQALRLSIPGWSNEYSILLKDSALVSVVGTLELMSRTKAIATSSQRFMTFYLAAALLYFIITFIGVRALRFLEKRTHVPGWAAPL